MPPASKRSQRTRRGAARSESPHEKLPETPTRPVKRRKGDHTASQPDHGEEDSSNLAPDQSGLSNIETLSDQDALLGKLLPHLVAPTDRPVQADTDHSNAIYEAHKEGVQAYAKIAAQNWTYYVTKLVVKIGRASADAADTSAAGGAAGAGADGTEDDDAVQIDLGPSKTVSREHALIQYLGEDEKWAVEVKGRNGIKIDGAPLKGGQSRSLGSGQVLEIGGVEMMFVLPAEISDLHVHPTYLQRAGLEAHAARAARGEASSPRRILPPASSSSGRQPAGGAAAGSSSFEPSSQQPNPPFTPRIAPAPPDYKRQGTPPSKSLSFGQGLQTPSFGWHSTLMVNGADTGIDLSLDENKHIKPQYSYAQMITQAIMQTAEHKLNLNGIYQYITTNYAYYRHQPPSGWQTTQNSIRHNLSLNKAFDKVARSTDEPGKGMKWHIKPEHRDGMTRTAFRGGRGGHRGSSAPSSPNNNQQLSYITQGPRDMAATRDQATPPRKRKAAALESPARSGARVLRGSAASPSSALRQEHRTPERSVAGAGRASADGPQSSPVDPNGSPRPRVRTLLPGGRVGNSNGMQARDGSGNNASQSLPAPIIRPEASASFASTVMASTDPAGESSPGVPLLGGTLDGIGSSSRGGGGSSLVTPAPLRVHPKLAPPSTMQRPSQHMPSSSPAPFWKFADINSTPLRGPAYALGATAGGGRGGGESSGSHLLDASSPLRAGAAGGGAGTSFGRGRKAARGSRFEGRVASSSPPRAGRDGSPVPMGAGGSAKRWRSVGVEDEDDGGAAGEVDGGETLLEDEDGATQEAEVEPEPESEAGQPPPSHPQEQQVEDEDEDEEPVFDLTKGFQSIGSYHAPAARGLPVPSAYGRK